MKLNKSTVIRILLAILFLICLADMPYGYYQLVRFLGLFGFAVLAYHSKENNHSTAMITYICLAVLFQPIIKIPLGRQMWNLVDLIVGLGLLISLFINSRTSNEK